MRNVCQEERRRNMCSKLGNGKDFSATNEYYELKTRIHDRLLYLIDLSLIESLDQRSFGRK